MATQTAKKPKKYRARPKGVYLDELEPVAKAPRKPPAQAPAPRRVIKPQPGFQYKLSSSRADITIGGGSAGCGKTWIELLAAARHMHVKDFTAAFFRKNMPQITHPRSAWDQSMSLYPDLGALPPNLGSHEWKWPSGAKLSMSHLTNMVDALAWHSSELALIIFDELTEFSEDVFWYMLTRNRSICGVKPYVIACCNPDADSWVATLIEWWIDQNEFLEDGNTKNPRYGLPIEERSGVLRYFTKIGEEMVWGDTREEVAEIAGVAAVLVKSITFIGGKLEENVELERRDPTYRGNLMAQGRVARARLLDGNWKVRASAGDYFPREKVRIIESVPKRMTRLVRAWDLGATAPSESNKDPDYSAGVLMGFDEDAKRFVVVHANIFRKDPAETRTEVRKTAIADGKKVRIQIVQDPGQAGKDQAKSYTTGTLVGFSVRSEVETGDKTTRADPFAAQWQAGNVDVVRGPWNALYLSLMAAFPTKGVHDDPPDASATAFKKVSRATSVWD